MNLFDSFDDSGMEERKKERKKRTQATNDLRYVRNSCDKNMRIRRDGKDQNDTARRESTNSECDDAVR